MRPARADDRSREHGDAHAEWHVSCLSSPADGNARPTQSAFAFFAVSAATPPVGDVPMSARTLALVLVVTLGACTASTGSVAAIDPQFAGARNSDVLYAADLVASSAGDVYEAVLDVRPDFFRRHDIAVDDEYPAQATRLRVFLNDVDVGGLDALRTIPLGNVTSVRFIRAQEATFRWGERTPAGAILVTTAP